MDDVAPTPLTITLDPNEMATWGFPTKNGNRFTVAPRQRIQLTFPPDVQVTECVVLTAPIGAATPGINSPFVKQAPIVLTAPFILQVNAATGTSWGMSIAFTLLNGQSSSFYFVPDPELQVGS